MAEIQLKNGSNYTSCIVDDRDIEFLTHWKWRVSNCGYAQRTTYKDKKWGSTTIHQMVWEKHNGAVPPTMEIDHKNRVKLDCRLENLRLVTRRGNTANSKNNKTGYPGVTRQTYIYKNGKKYPREKQYRARIRVGGVDKSLGFFKTPEEAYEAYRKVAEEMDLTSTVAGEILSQQVGSLNKESHSL